jgi:glycosyltransferase involved in cell wall biosynthesis
MTSPRAQHVTVAIPTFKRPRMLKRLLDALEKLETTAFVSVLVADNDAEGHQGLDLCNALAATYRWPLRAVIAHQRGIAQVRNTLVTEALKDGAIDFICMIDDDEWPGTNWVEELLKVQHQTGADALQGSILFEIEQGGSHSTPDIRGKTGPVGMLKASGNIMLCAARLRAMTPPWFDPLFALTGGEDADFFMRLKAEGARFAWSDEARAYGDVPAVRETLRWTLTRAYSNGNSDMIILLKYRPGFVTRLAESGKILATLLLSAPAALLLLASAHYRAAPLEKLFRAAGKLSAMFGSRYQEYAVIHGE